MERLGRRAASCTVIIPSGSFIRGAFFCVAPAALPHPEALPVASPALTVLRTRPLAVYVVAINNIQALGGYVKGGCGKAGSQLSWTTTTTRTATAAASPAVHFCQAWSRSDCREWGSSVR